MLFKTNGNQSFFFSFIKLIIMDESELETNDYYLSIEKTIEHIYNILYSRFF